MTIDPVRAAYFLDTDVTVFEYETVEISHPNIDPTIRFVRNNAAGITATLETAEEVTFPYLPMRVTRASVQDGLDVSMKFVIGDLGDSLPAVIDGIRTAGGFGTKPVLTFRGFRSDDFSEPSFGPVSLEIGSLPRSSEGAAFDATARQLNLSRTGERYSIVDHPPLRSLL
jgi:hypothetical protein